MYLAIKHFRYFVEGRSFHILTDHKPITYALVTPSDQHTPRQIRHLDYISQFTTDIRYVAGAANPAADAFPRLGTNAVHEVQQEAIDFKAMAEAQVNDSELLEVRATPSSLVLTDVPLPTSESTVVCDTSSGAPRPFVPARLCRAMLCILCHTQA